MIHRANPTQVRMPAKCLQLRILIQKLPSIILRIIPYLLLPRTALASPMARIRTECGKRRLVTILPFIHNANSYSCYLQSTRSVPHSAGA